MRRFVLHLWCFLRARWALFRSGSRAAARLCAPVLLLTCTLCSQAASQCIRLRLKGLLRSSSLCSGCHATPFCLFIDHTIVPLPARERLARSGPAGKVIFIWSPSFPMHKLYFACWGGVGGVCACQIQSSHINVETKMRLAHTLCVVLHCENTIHRYKQLIYLCFLSSCFFFTAFLLPKLNFLLYFITSAASFF